MGKLTGLYDRDENLIRKTTLDEVPTLFWVATLDALLIWLAGRSDRRRSFGRDQAVGVWALLFASMVTIRALARKPSPSTVRRRAMSDPGRRRDREWITRRFRRGAGTEGVRGSRERRARRYPSERRFARQRCHGSNGNNGSNGSNGNGHNGSLRDDLERMLTAERVERAIIAPTWRDLRRPPEHDSEL